MESLSDIADRNNYGSIEICMEYVVSELYVSELQEKVP